MKACLQIKPMYCSRDYNFTSRFNQQYEKSTSNNMTGLIYFDFVHNLKSII